MRTDSVNMRQVALNQIYSLVEKKFGKRISDPLAPIPKKQERPRGARGDKADEYVE